MVDSLLRVVLFFLFCLSFVSSHEDDVQVSVPVLPSFSTPIATDINASTHTPSIVKQLSFDMECGLGWGDGEEIQEEQEEEHTEEERERWRRDIRADLWETLLPQFQCSALKVLREMNRGHEKTTMPDTHTDTHSVDDPPQGKAEEDDRILLMPGGHGKHGFGSQINSVLIPTTVQLVGLEGRTLTAATGTRGGEDPLLWNYGCRKHPSIQVYTKLTTVISSIK